MNNQPILVCIPLIIAFGAVIVALFMQNKNIQPMVILLIAACIYIIVTASFKYNYIEGLENNSKNNKTANNIDDHVSTNLTIDEIISKAEKEHEEYEGVDRQSIQASLQAKPSNQLPIMPLNKDKADEPVASEGFCSCGSNNFAEFQ